MEEGFVGSNVLQEGSMCTRGVGGSMDNWVGACIGGRALCDLPGGFFWEGY
jgi:hypothetical protein